MWRIKLGNVEGIYRRFLPKGAQEMIDLLD